MKRRTPPDKSIPSRQHQRVWQGLSLDCDAPSESSGDAPKRPAIVGALEASSSCGINLQARAPEETACLGCKRLQLVTQLYEEQKSLAEALNTRNFNLAALNSNLLMHLNSLQTAAVPVALTAPPDSMHLRICLPEEYGVQMMPSSPEEGSSGRDAPAPVPMLHMWVDAEMTLQAVRQSMHNFVAAPRGQEWQLSLVKGGDLVDAAASPKTLQLSEGSMLFAQYKDLDTCRDSGQC